MDWEIYTSERWTHQLTPNIEVWYNCTSVELNYHLTHVFTGHGKLNGHQTRFKVRNDIKCLQWEYGDKILSDLGEVATTSNLVACSEVKKNRQSWRNMWLQSWKTGVSWNKTKDKLNHDKEQTGKPDIFILLMKHIICYFTIRSSLP